jgi:hypothetical protein
MRHEAHSGPLHGFTDGHRIIGIVFRAQTISFYISRVNVACYLRLLELRLRRVGLTISASTAME